MQIPPENPLHKYAQKPHFKQYVILGTIFLLVLVANLFRLGRSATEVAATPPPDLTAPASRTVAPQPAVPVARPDPQPQSAAALDGGRASAADTDVSLPTALRRIEPVLERYDALIRSLELQKAAALQRGTQEDQTTAGLMTLQIEQIRSARDRLLLSTAQENGAAAP